MRSLPRGPILSTRIVLVLVVLSLLDGYATPAYECGLDGEEHYVPCSLHSLQPDAPGPEMRTPECECEFHTFPCKLPTTKKEDSTVSETTGTTLLMESGIDPRARFISSCRGLRRSLLITHCALLI